MRDKKRIKPFLKQIETLWNKYPDWRFCQLVINVAKVDDPFYVEDDKFLEKLQIFWQWKSKFMQIIGSLYDIFWSRTIFKKL